MTLRKTASPQAPPQTFSGPPNGTQNSPMGPQDPSRPGLHLLPQCPSGILHGRGLGVPFTSESLTSEPLPTPSLTPYPRATHAAHPSSNPAFLSLPDPMNSPSSHFPYAQGLTNHAAHPTGDRALLCSRSSCGRFISPS